MTDTPKPRSNAISPVVFMGSGGPDLTAVNAMGQWIKALNTALGDRAKMATKIGQSIEFNETGTAALSGFIGGLSEAIHALAARHDALSAKLEAAGADRDLNQIALEECLEIEGCLRVELREAEAELDAYREMHAEINANGGPNVVRLQMQARRDRIRAESAEAERDAALGVLYNLHHAVCGETGFVECVRRDSGKAYPWPALDNADQEASALLAAHQKGSE